MALPSSHPRFARSTGAAPTDSRLPWDTHEPIIGAIKRDPSSLRADLARTKSPVVSKYTQSQAQYKKSLAVSKPLQNGFASSARTERAASTPSSRLDIGERVFAIVIPSPSARWN